VNPSLSWHIFRKDWRLMWPLAVATALLQVVITAVIRHSEPFPLPEAKSIIASLLTLGLAISMTLLILLTIQQEAIPSINQDWLTRPVKRRDLLLGKLFTLALLIHGPIVVVDILHGLAEGFAPGSVIHATLVSNFEIALCYSLPVMAVASMTRSVVEAIIFGLVILVVGVSVGFVASSTGGTGLKWIWRSVAHGELLLVTMAALWWQYTRRSRDGTQQARALFAVGVLAFTLIQLLPWEPAFFIQRSLAANPQASRQIAVEVVQGASYPTRQLLAGVDAPDRGNVRIVVPLRFSAFSADTLIHGDRTSVRLVGSDGVVVFSGVGRVFDVPSDGDGWPMGPPGTVGQAVDIPADVYKKISEQPLRLELGYYATLLRRQLITRMALNETRRIPGFGWCATRNKISVIDIGCRTAGALPFCISVTAGTAPEAFQCELNYEPVPLRFSVDPIDHWEVKIPTLPRAELAPIEFAFRVYEPEDHFFREVVVPRIRLRDLSP